MTGLLETYLMQRAALKRFLRARLGNDDEAEDLVQDLYFRLQRASPDEGIQNPVSYIFKMALNAARDYRRERQRSQTRDGQWVETTRVTIGTEPIANLPAADAALDAKERLAAILSALGTLSPQCRRVFLMHKFEEMTHAEISERIGISRSTVEKHMNTALKHLVARLGRD